MPDRGAADDAHHRGRRAGLRAPNILVVVADVRTCSKVLRREVGILNVELVVTGGSDVVRLPVVAVRVAVKVDILSAHVRHPGNRMLSASRVAVAISLAADLSKQRIQNQTAQLSSLQL